MLIINNQYINVFIKLYQFLVIFNNLNNYKNKDFGNHYSIYIYIFRLFDYKLKDDGVYPHLLKIYIHLLSKYGITKSIDNPYLAIKVIRKGVFSINL